MTLIRFSEPFRTHRELPAVQQVLQSPVWHGDGEFTRRATSLLMGITGAGHALLTTSCTHALELAGVLLELGPGDEVICPSFTFSSTATAIAARGATPVLVDVRADTLNIDVAAVEAALTPRTRAVYVVHYGGIAVDVEALAEILEPRGIALVEDNAHGLGGSWRERPLGSFGCLAAQSFHDTKNVTSGEGGALLVNDVQFAERAEVVREKGTNRARFLRGQVDKYTWVDHGSSYLPSDLLAAVLTAQLESFDEIQALRHRVWDAYAEHLPAWAGEVGVDLMSIPEGAGHPAHLYFLMMPSGLDQAGLIGHLRQRDIVAAFHYQALDQAPAGHLLCRTPAPCPVSARASERLVRLPLHAGLSGDDVERILEGVTSYRPRG